MRSNHHSDGKHLMIMVPTMHGNIDGATFRDQEVDGPRFVKQHVGGILKKGITIAGRHFEYLAYSSSALKSKLKASALCSAQLILPHQHILFGLSVHLTFPDVGAKMQKPSFKPSETFLGTANSRLAWERELHKLSPLPTCRSVLALKKLLPFLILNGTTLCSLMVSALVQLV
jgi:hypothetical protein